MSWGFEAVEVVRVLRARGCDSAGNIDYSVFFGKLGQTSAVDELAMSAAGVVMLGYLLDDAFQVRLADQDKVARRLPFSLTLRGGRGKTTLLWLEIY